MHLEFPVSSYSLARYQSGCCTSLSYFQDMLLALGQSCPRDLYQLQALVKEPSLKLQHMIHLARYYCFYQYSIIIADLHYLQLMSLAFKSHQSFAESIIG